MKSTFSTTLAVIAMCAAGFAQSAYADCFDEAATYQHVNPTVLRAIAWLESHNQPDSVHTNKNGSVDYGVMQINSIHLPELARYGVDRQTLLEPCKNVYIAAWQLRRQVLKYGDTWAAIGAYHSETPALRDRYAAQVARILRRWVDAGWIDGGVVQTYGEND
ncbi:lytic transglycosylase domain-containing protein [Paraburkholderia bannensis]|uniref:lytic transglycosylase domain-containing protein n=1 Tax=Paraburkholderia bannensis TaxID=765414 RepID=UPI002AB6E4C4|nr:lytic transglycosylase domain-containing protein [Paraburkholderia bannensis]